MPKTYIIIYIYVCVNCVYITGAENCKIKLYYYNTFNIYIPKTAIETLAVVYQRQCVFSRIYFTIFFFTLSYSSKINC
jgi:hypothetical protein